LRLAEPFLPGESRLAERLPALASDPDPRVRFQLLCTLGGLDSPAARAARDRLLFAGIEDEWMQVAALSASSDQAVAYLDRALAPGTGLIAREGPGRAAFLRQAAGVEIGRASCRERGWGSGGGASLQEHERPWNRRVAAAG